jgi:hypothetical protein
MQIPSTYRAAAVPKRVILFVFLLGLSLAILGLVGSQLVIELNSAYSEIVERQLPSLGLIREINQGQSQNRRLIDSIPLNLAQADVVEIRKNIESMRMINSQRLDKLEQLLGTNEASALIQNLRVVRSTYNSTCDRLMDVLTDEKDRNSWELQRALMIEADVRYVDAQDLVATYCEESAAARSDNLSRRSKDLTNLFFVVAAWPLLLAIVFFTYGLISTMALFYRSKIS